MTKPKKPPHSTRVLSLWADAYARERGVGRKRVRNWISYMVLGGQLERASSFAEGPRFTIKGAVALEMRLPYRARATKDIDLIVSGANGEDLVAVLRNAVDGTFQDFTFRVKGEPHVMPNDAVRIQVAIEYRGKSWSTLQVDLSRQEGAQRRSSWWVPWSSSRSGCPRPPRCRASPSGTTSPRRSTG